MASNTPTPGNPRPNDRTPSDTPPQSEPQLGEWLGAEEVGPAPGAGSHDPDPITEQVLFDDLLPLTNPPAPSGLIPTADPVTPAPIADPEDAVAGGAPPTGMIPGSSLFEGGRVPDGSDVFSASPSSGADAEPTSGPGSSIFEITPPPVGEGGPTSGNSDVLTGSLEEGSDVLRQIGRPDSGNSNIFDARPEGSGRFEDPKDATEPVTEIRVPDPSGEWAASDPLHPESHLFDDLTPADTDPLRPGSEVFDRPDSGVFENRPGSEVFGTRPGSEVFERPGSEVFERQPDSGEPFEAPPDSELFHPAPEDNPRRPGSDVFREAPTVAGQVWPGSEVFGEEPTDADLLVPDDGREAADDQHDIQFEDSGVDLLNPMSDQPDAETSGGSIFDLERTEGDSSDLDVDALPMPSDAEATESIHLPTGETGPRSDLFRDPDPGTDDHDRVSFELPDRPPGDAEPSQQVSGLIDWAAPVEGAELAASEGLTESEARAAGVPDLQSLAGAATTPAPATTPGPARRPPSTIPDMSMTERRRPGSRPDSRPGSQWMFPEPAPARSSKTGWLAGTALGLLLGAGGVGGAYLGGLLPSKESDKTPPVTQGRPATQPPTVAEAPPGSPAALLAGGDPAAALKAYEAAGEVSSPEDRAGRGQARFLARLRELAGQGTAARADDPQFQQATTDLEAVVQAAGTLETDEQKRAGALAALHLGLIKELTGDSKGAQERYRAGQKAFPAYRRMFDTALTRERLAPKAAPVKTARLTPQEAEELAQLAILGTVLLQAATGDALDDEAGFHFWEASELNSARRYKEAAAALSRAIAAHEKRRMALAGRGLNPLSDPLEQIFPRACAEIREYWVFKMHFYGHEQLGNELRQHAQKGTFPQFLSSVVTLREQAKQGGDGTKIAQVQAALDKASGELKAATAAAAKALAEKDAAAKELMTATTTATKAAAEKDAIAKDLTAAKTSLDEQTKQLADARKGLDDARAKQKAADDTLAAVVKELRANKLIGETDDAAAAVAKLPDVVRKASAAATSTDAKKAAEALVTAQQDLEAARAGTDKAEAVAKKAADEAKALRDKLDAQVKSASEAAKTMQDRMDAEVKKATQTATTDARKKLDDLSAQLASTRDELTRRDAERADAVKKAEAEKADSLRKAEAAFAAKLEEQKEFYRRRVEEAQSGVLAPLAMADSSARDRASQEFDTGARLLLTQRYAEAETWLERATRGNASDARYWYYLGLAQALQNKPAYAESIKKGAELETRNQPGRRALNDALEPLPGSYRQWLSRFRP